MKRIIKFRGKDKKTGKWVYGDLTHSKGFNADIPEFMYNRVMVANYEVDENTVGQLTGLKDGKGNDVWEHDFVKHELGIWEIRWDEFHAGFYMFLPDNDKIFMQAEQFTIGRCEVVGNIFDKPEKKDDYGQSRD